MRCCENRCRVGEVLVVVDVVAIVVNTKNPHRANRGGLLLVVKGKEYYPIAHVAPAVWSSQSRRSLRNAGTFEVIGPPKCPVFGRGQEGRFSYRGEGRSWVEKK